MEQHNEKQFQDFKDCLGEKEPHSGFPISWQHFPFLINWVSLTERSLTLLLTHPSTHQTKSSNGE